MISSGIKASELIKKLQEQIQLHGDRECYCGGTDYPDGVVGVTFNYKGDAYIPSGSFKIYTN